ncbi:MAG: hypothetical protein IPJ32_21265 [Sphingobacteriaceae bacterium]|nr:hypothetical protein [Sphingobacteriaceae bacterium]
MTTLKIIPALALLTLSLNAKPNSNNTTLVETVKNKINCPAELLSDKNEKSVRLSFKVNESGKAENVIINAEDEKVKQFVNEKLNKLEFPQKNEEVSMVIHFKLV